jgi:hypothetical protein
LSRHCRLGQQAHGQTTCNCPCLDLHVSSIAEMHMRLKTHRKAIGMLGSMGTIWWEQKRGSWRLNMV